ncbi:type II toxin-antitoxin system RelB/DinJ family antitoxin [Sphingobium sp.]|uniref:type II toxin-antitoxin system RelB/DinJ family antitoxin n=1 Tax=Sphingobium sp. TaxID=1912891 RepID=UPI000DB710C7|nr:type II toxin-antitoxin system RelB/DinJ family antitoxin [Sphingobium sp.]PZU64020.1 MAG: type II toxin-antitoxin system antitoxin, RelB/DinJ family [Sphingobium sp.]
MANNALIQTRIDSDVKDRASAVFERMGLTVSDAVRILLTRTAREGVAPMELLVERQAYDQWFRARVQEALDDDRPDIDDTEVAARFAELRVNARKGIKPVQ